MSASTKKKLRKEQNAAALTEKQLKEQAEAKKLKLSSIIFAVVMIAVLATSLTLLVFRGVQNTGVIQKNTTAAVVGDHKINSLVMNYYFRDTVTNTYNEWTNMYGTDTALMLSLMQLDVTKPLDEQVYPDGGSWADYFMDIALERARADYITYDIAMKEGYTLSAEDNLNLESSVNYKDLYAMYSGYSDVDDYMVAMYGPGASRDSYYEYAKVSAIASAYYNDYSDTLTYSDADIRAYEADKKDNYNAYTYASYYLGYNRFLADGTTDPSQEEISNAAALAKAEAMKLMSATTVEELDSAIADLTINAESTTAASTKSNNVLYPSVNSVIRQWVSDPNRKAGDLEMIPNEVTSTDADGNEYTAINGYYVVRFESATDNIQPMANVRHLLVSFEGGTTNENGTVTYSDEEIAAAKATAEGYLKTWQDGEATEESFIELVMQYSMDSSATDGGLFEDIHPASPYVPNFLNWAIDPSRQVGDVEVIETEYGFHVMYFSSYDELTYRDYMITEEMRDNDLEVWFTNSVETAPMELRNTSKIYTDIVLGG
jgi:hypothetical protein